MLRTHLLTACPYSAIQLVRSVARRDADDRTVSELIRFQDSLDRLGLLWTPLDCFDKHQSLELVRNLHVSCSEAGKGVRYWSSDLIQNPVPCVLCQSKKRAPRCLVFAILPRLISDSFVEFNPTTRCTARVEGAVQSPFSQKMTAKFSFA